MCSLNYDNVFVHEAVSLKFGEGVTAEVGEDLRRMGVRRAMLVTDPHLASLGYAERVEKRLEEAGVGFQTFDRVNSEPTDESWNEAIDFAQAGHFDSFVAVGGGSSIDTAKAANLYSTYPADLLEYMNRPVGRGSDVPGPLKPLVGIPTTAGTASECTGIAIVDVKSLRLKTGISHRLLRPALAILDPENTLTCPPMVTACCGIDVLCHAVESFTALPYGRRSRPKPGASRPVFVGSNPISDLWSARAIELVARYLVRAVRHPTDREARTQMMLACTYAGMGFGNAGVHVPHAMAYPIAGGVRAYIPPDYPHPHPMVPHGMSVIVGAPAAFRFTSRALPEKHLEAARLMGADTAGVAAGESGEVLAQAVLRLMDAVGIPRGTAALGYTAADTPELVEGTWKQQRLLAQSPCPVTRPDLEAIFEDALK
ncbi:MAG: iron-containing alcohol dehydrogenase [Planctomycetes bacterium]|nr:iron-containing alcohol dehydrogenase [Planctomycetota bacterium]